MNGINKNTMKTRRQNIIILNKIYIIIKKHCSFINNALKPYLSYEKGGFYAEKEGK